MMLIDMTAQLSPLIWGLQAAFLISGLVLVASAIYAKARDAGAPAAAGKSCGARVLPLSLVQRPGQRAHRSSGKPPYPEAA